MKYKITTMRIKVYSILILIFCIQIALAQNNTDVNKGKFEDYQPGFYMQEILPDLQNANNKSTSSKQYFIVDFENAKYPTDLISYNKFWHNKPLSQGNTGTCWAFASTSFFESEINRLSKKEIKLSEMYIVYWEYVERAKDYVKTRGETYYEQGSEAYAWVIIAKKYGIVPQLSYKGNAQKTKFHSHSKMIQEIKAFLESVKQSNNWNQLFVTQTVKEILNTYMGVPPEKVVYNNKEYTPQQYLKNICGLKMNDYFNFMSTKSKRFNEKAELVEADNWRFDDSYYNLSVQDYFDLIVATVKAKQTICICGDVSEPGINSRLEVAVIPAFDIPSELINDDSRQMRLSNGATTDDHCIHIVGYKKVDNDYWFLIKDSGAGAFDGVNKGYRFYNQDYVKLKMMNIIIHKEQANTILNSIIK